MSQFVTQRTFGRGAYRVQRLQGRGLLRAARLDHGQRQAAAEQGAHDKTGQRIDWHACS
jgi:hypothetical protein